MEIIVLSIAAYKEKDAVVTAITNTKTFSFFAKGILNPKSKNAFLNCALAKANITLIEGKIKYPILESATLISTPLQLNISLDYLNAINVITEAATFLMEEEEKFLMYDKLDNALKALKNGANVYLVCLYFLINLLPIIGVEIDVTRCVKCGSQRNIVDLDLDEGGFLCGKCSHEQRKYNNDQLKLVMYCIKCKELTFESQCTDIEMKKLLFDLNVFIEESIGVHLKFLNNFLN